MRPQTVGRQPPTCGRGYIMIHTKPIRRALRYSAAAQVAIRGMGHTGKRWLRGLRLDFQSTMGEGWPMGVGAVA